MVVVVSCFYKKKTRVACQNSTMGLLIPDMLKIINKLNKLIKRNLSALCFLRFAFCFSCSPLSSCPDKKASEASASTSDLSPADVAATCRPLSPFSFLDGREVASPSDLNIFRTLSAFHLHWISKESFREEPRLPLLLQRVRVFHRYWLVSFCSDTGFQSI